MINSKKVKRFGAKLLSAVLVAGLLGGILPEFGKEETGKVEAAEPWVAQRYRPSTVRKVVNTFAEMQTIIKPENRNKEIGTKERPFVILEVVNFVDNAHIGYTIGGCEPTAVEDMFGLKEDVFFSNLNSNGKCVSGTKISTDVYFFEDEKEGNSTWYESFGNPPKHSDTNPITVNGYYEVVEAGQGQFVKEKDAVTHLWTLKKDSHGNIVWHTVNEFLNSRDEFSGIVYDGDVTNIGDTALTSIGSRLYTTRTTDASNVAYNMKDKYFYVENNEVFLHSVMELTPEEASNYSVVVKSATIKELNTNPEWVDYADFIYFSNIAQKAINHNAVWGKYNRLGVPATSDADRNAKPNILHNDLDWTVCQKIIDKITAETNYAALVWDKTIYNNDDVLTQKSVRYNLRDTNLNKTSYSSESFTGSINNIKKLALCTVNINPNLMNTVFKDIELEEVTLTRNGSNVIYKTPVLKHLLEYDASGNVTPESKDVAKYWGEYTFMLLKDGEKRSDLDYDWSNPQKFIDRYTGTDCIVKSDTAPFAPSSVNNRVYTFNGNTNFIMGFTTDAIGASDELFPEFSQYMKDHYPGDNRTAANANPVDAVRYILGLHDKGKTKFDGTINVLDIEPSVDLNSGHKPIWTLKESSIYFMLPSFSGDV
ncbi:MAG: hypothetical protein SPI28_09890, partial [Acetatifactor sp.]|nr:hypothetical protein [Acetatifactor sp.]